MSTGHLARGPLIAATRLTLLISSGCRRFLFLLYPGCRLPTPPEWGPPPQHLFTTWYNPQTIPQPVFKPSPFSQAGTAYQAATAPYGAPGLPVAGSGFSYAGAGAGSVPPAVAPIGQAILLETGSGALAGRNSADALLSDANAVAAVVGAAARAEVPDAAAAAGMEAHRLARVLALHESLVMAHRLEATAKYASALHDASSGASSSPAVASAASTAHRNVAAGIMSDLLAESEHSAGR